MNVRLPRDLFLFHTLMVFCWFFFIFSIDLKKLVTNLDMDNRNWKIIEYENEKN
jgi:hypothetical protein